MKRLALLVVPIMCLAGPASAADLDGPTYTEQGTYVRPPIIDRKIVEHHHYHHQAPALDDAVQRRPLIGTRNTFVDLSDD